MNDSFSNQISATPSTSSTQKGKTQRTNIIEGARRAFARKGKSTTMADVAEAAGVSQGLAYRYFGSKEEIYSELIKDAAGKTIDLTAGSDGAASTWEQLTLLIERVVEVRRDNLERFQLLDHVLNAENPLLEVSLMVLERRKTFLDRLRQLIVEGQETGEVASGDPDRLVTAIAACLEGMVKLGIREPEGFSERCPDADILLRMLRSKAREGLG